MRKSSVILDKTILKRLGVIDPQISFMERNGLVGFPFEDYLQIAYYQIDHLLSELNALKKVEWDRDSIVAVKDSLTYPGKISITSNSSATKTFYSHQDSWNLCITDHCLDDQVYHRSSGGREYRMELRDKLRIVYIGDTLFSINSYDDQNRLIKIRYFTERNDYGDVITYEYDSKGTKTTTSTSNQGAVSIFVDDAKGNNISYRGPLGEYKNYTYDDKGRFKECVSSEGYVDRAIWTELDNGNVKKELVMMSTRAVDSRTTILDSRGNILMEYMSQLKPEIIHSFEHSDSGQLLCYRKNGQKILTIPEF
jgi:hypothetical protein